MYLNGLTNLKGCYTIDVYVGSFLILCLYGERYPSFIRFQSWLNKDYA